MAEIIFWGALFLTVYIYIGYPLTLKLLPHAAGQKEGVRDVFPSVSVLIAAYNEAAHICAILQNKLDLDYPKDLLEIIVVSDGSSDETDEIVRAFEPQGVRLLRQAPRQGKTLALNRAAQVSRGEILVFSDANSIYDTQALRRLVCEFTDPRIGYVTGKLLYQNPGQSASGAGCGAYMRYENWIRVLETKVGSVVGVNGGIDAVRRNLYSPMRADQIPDFVLPLKVVAQGYRVVFAPGAILYEDALQRSHDEFRMRVRVTLRSFHALYEMKYLMEPRYGLFSFQLLVHKVLRYFAFVALGAIGLSNLFLLNHRFYQAAMAVQVLFYLWAILGWTFEGKIKRGGLGAPFYFILINLAAAFAFFKFLMGERQVIWTPRKGA